MAWYRGFHRSVPLLAMLGAGCALSHRPEAEPSADPDGGADASFCTDADGDGFADTACGGLDCRDDDASINVSAPELCNDVDDDCDGEIDEGAGCTDIVEVAGMCVRLRNGSVRCFTSVEPDAAVNVEVEGIDDAVSLSDRACAVEGDGSVRCWLCPGELSTDCTDPYVAEPIEGLTDVVQFAGRASTGPSAFPNTGAHGCGVRRDGSVWCVGGNVHGRLGRGFESSARDEALPPGPVLDLDDAARVVVARTDSTCVLRRSGNVACWGYGYDGALGTGDRQDRFQPTAVPGVSGAIAIAAGQAQVCVGLAGGGIQCWGRDDDGLVTGTASDEEQLSPVWLARDIAVRSLSIGSRKGLVASTDGRLFEWGFLPGGSPGFGPPNRRSPPNGVDQVSGSGFALDFESGLYASLGGGFFPVDLGL